MHEGIKRGILERRLGTIVAFPSKYADLPLSLKNRKKAKNEQINEQEHVSRINVSDQTILLRQPS